MAATVHPGGAAPAQAAASTAYTPAGKAGVGLAAPRT